jgi:isoleucyl-tRNA synthetase
MKSAAAKIEALKHDEIQSIMEGASLSIDVPCEGGGSRALVITQDKPDIRRIEKANLRVLNDGTLTVGLDTEITRELSMEGDIRDLIRGVQNARKEMGLSVTDRIELCLYGADSLKEAWDNFGKSAADETLAVKTQWAKTDGQIPIEAGDETWQVKITKSSC